MMMKKLNIGNLSISVPIVQGGMGVGISLSGLASAVANEGGVGVISSAGLGLLYRNLSKDYIQASIMGLKEELRKAREKTKGVIGVNVMVAMSNFADMVKTAIAEKADIIFSGAGLPLNLPSFLQKDSVTKLVPIVSSARAARVITEKWHNLYNYLPDAFVVEGPKAGGHLGFKDEQINDEHFSLEHILPEVIDEVKDIETHYGKNIPVIVAGGIYTGEAKAVAAFSPVSSALTDGDTPASALAEAPETTPDICAPMVASSCALTWSKYPVPDDIVYSCF